MPSGIVSIHAPARGATCRLCRRPALNHRFNPRAREGRDSRTTRDLDWLTVVSIHAPARGATSMSNMDAAISNVSIHAPARGATNSQLQRRTLQVRFNPRAREGRDAEFADVVAIEGSFQSTRPRGARPGRKVSFDNRLNVSIHAPARGATYCSGVLRVQM